MSSKVFASGGPHCVVPLALLCFVCLTVAFSSVLYSIAARRDIDALRDRLSALESRSCFCSCCSGDTPSTDSSNQPSKKTDDGLPSLLDSVVDKETSSSQEMNNDLPSGEQSSQSSRLPIHGLANTESVILASHVHILHPKREFHKEVLTPPIIHPVERRMWSSPSNLEQAANSDFAEESLASMPTPTDHEKQLRHLFKRSSLVNREFTNEDEVEDVSRTDRRRGGRRRGGAREEPTFRGGHRMTGNVQTLALHFDGNTSKYSLGHRHYEGNGRLRHPDGIFRDWRMKEWSGRHSDRQQHFHENDGTLNIRESGIYFVYAQVYYSDDHDINGFRVLVNDSPVLQCTTMTHGGAPSKVGTCFTGGMVELYAGDILVLRDLAAMRYSIFEPGKSFFGLFRVAHYATGTRESP